MSSLYHPFYNPEPSGAEIDEARREGYLEESRDTLFQQNKSLKHELEACKQLLKESIADNEKYRKALINLADYVLPHNYKQEVLKILGYTNEGLD
jgi:hypothetical protein